MCGLSFNTVWLGLSDVYCRARVLLSDNQPPAVQPGSTTSSNSPATAVSGTAGGGSTAVQNGGGTSGSGGTGGQRGAGWRPPDQFRRWVLTDY